MAVTPPPLPGSQGWPQWVPPPPPQQPERRGSYGWEAAFVIGLVIAYFLLAPIFFSFVLNPGGLCRCPGNTPLGSSFEFGNASSETVHSGSGAQAGCSSPETGTEYCEIITIANVSSGLTPASIGFQLQNSSGVASRFASVTLLDSHRLGVEHIMPNSPWETCNVTLCHAGTSPFVKSNPVTLNTSYVFLLDAGQSGAFPGGLASFWLVGIGTGAFSGTVSIHLA
jgi:hypothetical protein